MTTKMTRLLTLSSALLWSSVVMAQSGSPTGAPTSAPVAPPGPATTTDAVLPADGTGLESTEVTVSTTEETLPATGGAPLLMALTGALTVGGALFGLKKVR